MATLLNRRRYIPEITSRNFNLRSFAERTAMNTPIQGTAADIIKKSDDYYGGSFRRRRITSTSSIASTR
ncbi:DNA polymerase [Bacillus pacificus]